MFKLRIKRAVSLGSALVALTMVGIAVTALVSVVTPTLPVDEAVQASASTFETADETCDQATLESNASGARCRPCKDRPWCDCSYNGLPRVSCNPCCYGSGANYTCLD